MYDLNFGHRCIKYDRLQIKIVVNLITKVRTYISINNSNSE